MPKRSFEWPAPKDLAANLADLEAANKEAEAYLKLPWWKQMLAAFGFNSQP